MKGLFKDYSGWVQLLMLVGLFVVGSIVFELIGYVVVFIQIVITSGIDSDIIRNFTETILANPAYIRTTQLCTAFGSFVLPAFVCAYLFSDNYKKYLSLNTRSNYKVYLLTILFVICTVPFINFTTMLNMQLDLPEWMGGLESWMKNMEELAGKVTKTMMTGKSAWTLLANLFIIAILAGIGEELFFRGVGQSIAGKLIKNQHVVIWVVAIIFSAMHFQFYGFLPRMLMGAYLGYLLYFTKNMWVPILAHFTNNAFGVLQYYFYQDSIEEIEQMDALGWGDTWWIALASLALLLFLLFQIKKQGEKELKE